MDEIPDLAGVAALIADAARARILWTLIDGTTRPAGELAYAANISASSASAHLAKLVEGGLLETEAQGRHRYFRIAGSEIAGLLEGLASLGAAARPRTPREPSRPAATPVQFLYARTCYGHLAGEMAVRLLEAMQRERWIRPVGAAARDLELTAAGEEKLRTLDIDADALRRSRRVFARACVDLTQRRPHLGGALGEALLKACVARGWINRSRRSRVVGITPKGYEGFRRLLAL